MDRSIQEMIRKLPLDRERAEPLHRQLTEGIGALVTGGFLKPGVRIPGVAELSQLCGVSKGTAMQAVGELRRRQVLVAKRRSGIHVAEAQPCATEVFFGDVPRRENSALGDFLQQVLDGLKEGYQEPARRFMVTLMNGHEPNAQGLYAAALARGVDGMVFYRPAAEVAAAAAEVARRLPCVSLFRPLGTGCCVAFDLAPAVKRYLQGRMAEGVRSFAYAGQLSLLKKGVPDGVHSPYAGFYDAAVETLAEAGLELTLCLTPNLAVPDIPEAEEQLLKRVATLPRGSVVLAQTGTLAQRIAGLGRGLSILTYTEYHGSLEACRGRAAVLYGGLELLGRAAALALKQAGGDPSALPGHVRVEPRMETGV